MRRLFLTYVLALLASVSMAQVAEAGDVGARADGSGAVEVLPDSSNFVTASILISSPGKELFFALGHCGLRLQCPSKGLDYCFSFSTIVPPGPEFNLLLLSGKMKAGYEALPYDEYLDTFRKDGRGVVEYPLNLTLSEERELWRKMDNLMMKGPTMKFDFQQSNCTSTLYRAIGSVMEREKIDYPRVGLLAHDARYALEEIYVGVPWLEFLAFTMLAKHGGDGQWPIIALLNPKLWQELLPQTDIVGLDGSRRPVLAEEPIQLLPLLTDYKPVPLTPNRFFGFLLFAAIVLTLFEWLFRWHLPAGIYDVVLAVLYTLFSLYLFYASCFQVFGVVWNPFFIIFNPLYLIIWLWGRRKAWFPRAWAAYSFVIVAFMVFLPCFTRHMEWPHELLLATLLVRSIYHSLQKPSLTK